MKWNEVTDQLQIFFHISVTGKPQKVHALPNKKVDFRLEQMVLFKELNFSRNQMVFIVNTLGTLRQPTLSSL